MQTDASTSKQELRSSSSKSSSSSSDSPLDGPFRDDGPKAAQPASPELSSLDASTTESPPIQEMGRPGETKYRIPSHVFARNNNKDNAAVEWSVASNESLFSIQMGTMSFIEDPLFSLAAEPTAPAPMFSYNPNDTSNKAADMRKSTDGKASETMMEVIRENDHDKSGADFSQAPSVSLCSDTSDASGKSFAFPVLGGDKHKNSSANRSSNRLRDDHAEDSTLPTTPTQTETQTQTQAQEQSQPSTEPSDQPKPSTFLASLRTRWLACFPCCACT